MRDDQITDRLNINPLTGSSVPYRSTVTNLDVLTVPGDLGSATTATSGEFIVRPPHTAPVFMDVGRTVVTYTRDSFTVDFLSGRQDILAYALGDTSVLEPLCRALGAG